MWDGRMDGRTDRHMDGVKPIYPPPSNNFVLCGVNFSDDQKCEMNILVCSQSAQSVTTSLNPHSHCLCDLET